MLIHAAYVLLQQCHDEIKVDFCHSRDVTTLAVVHTQVMHLHRKINGM